VRDRARASNEENHHRGEAFQVQDFQRREDVSYLAFPEPLRTTYVYIDRARGDVGEGGGVDA